MRILILAFAFLLFSPVAFAEEDPNGFRGMIWGVTKEDVRKFESAVFYKEEDNKLYFLEEPDKFRRIISYEFAGGKLVAGRSEYAELHDPDPKTIMTMFGDRQIEFEKKYGEADSQEFIWKNKKYLYYPQFWTRALQSGDLRMKATWRGKDTEITLETWNDGSYYQLVDTATWADPAAPQKDSVILNLPGVKPPEKKQP